MSTPSTYGELMSLAYQHLRTAERRIALTRIPSTDAARDLVQARHHLLLAAQEQAESLYGVLRLNAQQEARPGRERPSKGSATIADARARAFVSWRESINAVTPSPRLDAMTDPCAAAVDLRRSAELVRAATDLLDTHRTTLLDEPRTLRDDGAVIEPLRIVQRLARTQHLYARLREVGLTASESNALLPEQAWTDLESGTQTLVAELPRQQTWLDRVPLAGTVRTDSPAHEWADRIERIPRRLRGLATRGPIGVDTMKSAAAAGLVSHYLRAMNGTAPQTNPWFDVVEQMRSWESVVPPDPRVAADSARLQQLARDARMDPDRLASSSLAAEAERTGHLVDELADFANQVMHSVDRWVRARPVPSHLRAPKAPPFVARVPQEVPIPWPSTQQAVL